MTSKIIFMVFAFGFLIPINYIHAEEELPEIIIEFLNGAIIDLDAGTQMIRAAITINNYNPQDGYTFMKVVKLENNTLIKESEILPSYIDDNVFGVQILHYLDPTANEDRKIAKILDVPEKLIIRHPFPGPGLAVRIIGEITPKKLEIAKVASKIVEDELFEEKLYDKVWQAYAAVGDDKAVGVVGDERKHGNIVMIRVVDSIDAMTADWTRLPHGLLEKISNRITNEIEDVTWVSYVISSKPPSTIEPQ